MAIKLQFDTLAELEDFAYVFHKNLEERSPVDFDSENIEHFEAGTDSDSAPIEDDVELDFVDSPRIPYEESYKYDFYKCYFKTPKGRGGRILIAGSEALEIIPLIKQGKGARTIWNNIGDFYHDEVTLHTLQTFIKRYNEGKLDKALSFYCCNSHVSENPKDYVKFR